MPLRPPEQGIGWERARQLEMARARLVNTGEQPLDDAPRALGRRYPKASLRTRRQGEGEIRQLLPDPIPGMLIDRMELPPRGRVTGVPHMPGTRDS